MPRTRKKLGVLKMENKGFVSGVSDMLRQDAVMPTKDTPSYLALKRHVEDLVLYQAEIEKRIRSENSPWKSMYAKVKSFVSKKILRRKEYTLEDLFDIQLVNIGKMNSNLKGILFSSKKEMASLESYFKKVSLEFIDNLKGVGEEKQNIEAKVSEYNIKMEELNSIAEKNEDYFKKEMEANQVKKEISENLHGYNMKNESIIDLNGEKRFLVVVQDFMRESTQLCERIAVKVERMSRHISSTKKTYDALKRQQCTVASLYEAVDTMTRFTTDIHNMLGNGLAAMSNIANSSNELNNFFSTAEGKLGGIINDIVEANKRKSEEVDEMVKGYLAK